MADFRWHLICYDVRDDRRREKAARLLLGYGDRVQYSVYRVRTTPRRLLHLRWELGRVLSDQDELLIVPLPENAARKLSVLEGTVDWTAATEGRYRIIG